jgi:hypothetical protein
VPRKPATGAMTEDYGPRAAPVAGASTNHLGIDLIGDGNFAPERGRLASYYYAGGLGNLVIFLGASGWWHYLGHNRDSYPQTPVGSDVAEGTRLSIMGTTGTSTGVHCHWETHRPGASPGSTIDPLIWLAQAQAATAGSGGTTPINEKDEDMTYALINRTPGPELPGVPANAVFIGSGTDPLVWISNAGPEQINGVTFAEWDAPAIADRISQVGLRGSGADLNRVYKSMADARAGGTKAVYTLGAGTVNVGDVAIDNAPVLAGLKALADAVAANKPPTAAQIAAAINEDTSKRLAQ